MTLDDNASLPIYCIRDIAPNLIALTTQENITASVMALMITISR